MNIHGAKELYRNYKDNPYGLSVRITNEEYRNRLTSWQVPAIKKHLGDLTGKVFIDLGAGDIVLGEKLNEIGIPKKFYVQDINRASIESGFKRLQKSGVDTSNIIGLVSDNFDFSLIEDNELDCAFSNSLFSHLPFNSIYNCLVNLQSKMKPKTKYYSSMIILPDNTERDSFSWHPKDSNTSFSFRDPYHYTEKGLLNNMNKKNTGFIIKEIHEYGHPFQKLVEFEKV